MQKEEQQGQSRESGEHETTRIDEAGRVVPSCASTGEGVGDGGIGAARRIQVRRHGEIFDLRPEPVNQKIK